jgi:hypothetical protein
VFVADTVRLVEYFYITAPDKPGEGGRALNALKDAGINLLAFSGFPQGRRAQMDFVPADPAAFKQAAKKAKWKVVGPKRGFLIQGDDRVGAVADLLDRLGAAKINVMAIDAVAVTDGRYGAIFWVAAKDVRRQRPCSGHQHPGPLEPNQTNRERRERNHWSKAPWMGRHGYRSRNCFKAASIIPQFFSECSRACSVGLLSWDKVTRVRSPSGDNSTVTIW